MYPIWGPIGGTPGFTTTQSAANEVLLKSREKVCDQIPKDDESGLSPVKIGLDGTWVKRGFRSLFGCS